MSASVERRMLLLTLRDDCRRNSAPTVYEGDSGRPEYDPEEAELHFFKTVDRLSRAKQAASENDKELALALLSSIDDETIAVIERFGQSAHGRSAFAPDHVKVQAGVAADGQRRYRRERPIQRPIGPNSVRQSTARARTYERKRREILELLDLAKLSACTADARRNVIDELMNREWAKSRSPTHAEAAKLRKRIAARVDRAREER